MGRIRVAAMLLAAFVAGCAAMGERQPQRYYVLEPRPTAGASHAATMIVAPTTAAGFYDTQDIVFSRAAGTRGYYQFNHWTERPQRVIQTALAARFESRGGGFILATHLVELYHDAAESPGNVRVTLVAEILEPARRTLVSRREFTRSVPVASHDAAGAVAAFDAALGDLLDDVVRWADAQATS